MSKLISKQILRAICTIKILEIIRHSCGHSVFFDDYDSLLKVKNVYEIRDQYLNFLDINRTEDKNLSPVNGDGLKLECKLVYCNMIVDKYSSVAVFINLKTGKISIKSFNKRLLKPENDRDALLILFSASKINPNWAIAAERITYHLDDLMASKQIPGVRSWDSLGFKRPDMATLTSTNERLHYIV